MGQVNVNPNGDYGNGASAVYAVVAVLILVVVVYVVLTLSNITPNVFVQSPVVERDRTTVVDRPVTVVPEPTATK